MDTGNTPSGVPPTTGAKRSRRLRWFAGGFALAFVGLLVFYPVVAMHPSGQYAVRQRLWAYYADAAPHFFGPSTLGPASSNSSSLVGTAVQHVALSVVGGCVAAGIEWWRRRKVA